MHVEFDETNPKLQDQRSKNVDNEGKWWIYVLEKQYAEKEKHRLK